MKKRFLFAYMHKETNNTILLYCLLEENSWVDPGLKLNTTMCIYKSNVHPIQIQDN